jgi:hypothetical protein
MEEADEIQVGQNEIWLVVKANLEEQGYDVSPSCYHHRMLMISCDDSESCPCRKNCACK